MAESGFPKKGVSSDANHAAPDSTQVEPRVNHAALERMSGHAASSMPGHGANAAEHGAGAARGACAAGRGAGARPAGAGAGVNGAGARPAGVGAVSRKKIAAVVAGVIAAVLVVVGVAAALWFASVSNDLNRGGKSDDELNALDSILAKTTFDEPFYVMLLGSDARADDASMGARSDTNIVVRVDPTKNQLTLVSIPRDTMIKIDGHGTNKFNAAYSFKGAPGAIEEANKLLGIEISHYVEVNFEELTALVDAVGGVDVEVESTIDDPKAGNVVIEKGLHHLDGEAALVYARTRQYADGDFTRTSHQRTLVSALAAKVLSLSPVEMPGVIQSAAKCVTTDLSVTDVIALAQQFQGGGELVVYSAMVPSTTGTVGGVSYVFADENALAEMMKVVERGDDPTGFTASPSAASKALAKYGVASEVTNVGSAMPDEDETQAPAASAGSPGSAGGSNAGGDASGSQEAPGSDGVGGTGSNAGSGAGDTGSGGAGGSGGTNGGTGSGNAGGSDGGTGTGGAGSSGAGGGTGTGGAGGSASGGDNGQAVSVFDALA